MQDKNSLTSQFRLLDANFAVIKWLRHGRYGAALCRNKVDHQEFLVKTIQLTDLEQEDVLSHLQILKTLDHPHVAKWIDAWLEEDQTSKHLLLQGKFFPAGSLRNAMENGQKFTLQRIHKIAKEILEALVYLHSSKENIFLSGQTKVGDIGCMTDERLKARLKSVDITSLTTSLYIAPEARGYKYDYKIDVFSLGIIIVELFMIRVFTAEHTHLTQFRLSRSVPREVSDALSMREKTFLDGSIRAALAPAKDRLTAGELLMEKFIKETPLITGAINDKRPPPPPPKPPVEDNFWKELHEKAQGSFESGDLREATECWQELTNLEDNSHVLTEQNRRQALRIQNCHFDEMSAQTSYRQHEIRELKRVLSDGIAMVSKFVQRQEISRGLQVCLHLFLSKYFGCLADLETQPEKRFECKMAQRRFLVTGFELAQKLPPNHPDRLHFLVVYSDFLHEDNRLDLAVRYLEETLQEAEIIEAHALSKEQLEENERFLAKTRDALFKHRLTKATASAIKSARLVDYLAFLRETVHGKMDEERKVRLILEHWRLGAAYFDNWQPEIASETHKERLELRGFSQVGIDLADRFLEDAEISPRNAVLILTHQADYLRRLARVEDQRLRPRLLDELGQLFKENVENAKELAASDPVRVSYFDNYAVFLYEDCGKEDEGKELREQTVNEALEDLKNLDDIDREECEAFLSFITTELKDWTASVDDF